MIDKEKIPNDILDAINYLERQLFEDIKITNEKTPSPTAPVGEQIAHALRANRLQADTNFIEELRNNYLFAKEINEKRTQ